MWGILLSFALILFIIWIRRHYSFWTKQGVPGPKPLPFAGNFGQNLIGKFSIGEILAKIYQEYEEYPFVGVYRATTPMLLVRDLDFIKNILVKDFKSFQDNDIEIDKELEPILGRNPFVLKGAEWKTTRNKLTSCFTSGKIKGMYPFLENTSKQMVKYIEEETKITNGLEAREICLRFTLDNVAACAFGLEGKAFEKTPSEFKQLAENFLSPEGASNKLLWAILSIYPKLLHKFKIKFISKDVEDRLVALVRGSLKYRKDNNVVRNDFLDVISNSNDNGTFTEVDIVGQAASFFADGYETSSRVMSFVLFELAFNLVAQEKLRNDINENIKKNNNQFSYEIINEMAYLDACISESMRKNSIAHHLTKVCTEDYTYSSTNPDYKKISVTLKPGDIVAIPLTALQTDPKYFDDPDKFVPERFISKENITKFTFLPFGDGPRSCLGMKFAQTQMKIGLAYIVKNFRLSVNSKTQMPLKLDPYFIMRHVIGGLWINFEKI